MALTGAGTPRRARAALAAGLASAGAVLALAPAAGAGTWTVAVGCGTPPAPGQDSATGFYEEHAPLFSDAVSCATPWNVTDASAANDGMRAWAAPGSSFAPSAGADGRESGFVFLAPGHVYLRTQAAGQPAHAMPDAPFAGQAHIVAVTASHAFYREGNAAFDVGLFANDLFYRSTGGLRLRGCGAGSVDGSSGLAGEPASTCAATAAGPAFLSASDAVALPPAAGDVRELSWIVRCPASASCQASSSLSGAVAVGPVAVTLSDTDGPEQAVQPGGLDSGPSPVGGTQQLTYDVRDLVGVDAVSLLVDGVPVAAHDYPTCGPSDGATVTTRVPCPQDADRIHTGDALGVDTTRLADGPHAAVLRGTDAVGNVTDTPFTFTVANGHAAGSPAAGPAGLRTQGLRTEILPAPACLPRGGRCRSVPSSRRVRAGIVVRRWTVPVSLRGRPVVRGRLRTTGGALVAHAPIVVYAPGPGGAYEPVAHLRTDSSGRFSYAWGGPSTALQLVFAGDSIRRAALAQSTLPVPARSTIAVDRPALRPGGRARFTGTVLSGPAAGRLVLLQARRGGRWRTVARLRADAQGNWSYGRRFAGTGRTTVYLFRALVPHENGYGYATGASAAVRVTVAG